MFSCPYFNLALTTVPAYITDTKCGPAVKPSNIITWAQELQLPGRNLSFIKEQIYSKHTILDNTFYPPLLMLAAQTSASFFQWASHRRKYEGEHSKWESWTLSQAEQKAVTLQGKWTVSAVQLPSVCRYSSPAVCMEVCFYESLVKHRNLSSYAQFLVIQRIVCL